MQLQPVDPSHREDFYAVVLDYWQELMPDSAIMASAAKQVAYFADRFCWEGDITPPHWGVQHDRRVGFVNFTLKEKRAHIHDFYVLPAERRKGYGRVLVQAIYDHFDAAGVQQIDLNVRRDNPHALAFWQSQGFGIALYQLRQYRDPHTGQQVGGALSSDADPT